MIKYIFCNEHPLAGNVRENPNGKKALPPDRVVTLSGLHSHRAGKIMNDPQTANQTRNIPRQGIPNSQHYLKVTHATQEDKIIQRIGTLSPIPTPHNQSSHMNHVQIEYQDHKTVNERYPPQVKNHMSKVQHP